VSQAIVAWLSLAAQLPDWGLAQGLAVSLVIPVAFIGATHALQALSALLYRSTQKGMLVDLLCLERPPLGHRVALRMLAHLYLP